MANQLPTGGKSIVLFVKSWEVHVKRVNDTFFPYFLLGASIGCINMVLFPLVSGLFLDISSVLVITESFFLLIAFVRSIVILFAINKIDKKIRQVHVDESTVADRDRRPPGSKLSTFLIIVGINYAASPRMGEPTGPNLLAFIVTWLFIFIILAKIILIFIVVLKPRQDGNQGSIGITGVLQETDSLIKGNWAVAFNLLFINTIVANMFIVIAESMGLGFLQGMPGIISLVLYVVIVAFTNGLVGGIMATTVIVLYYKCMADKGRIAREDMPPVLDILWLPRPAPSLPPSKDIEGTSHESSHRHDVQEDTVGYDDDDNDYTVIANTCLKCGETVPIYTDRCPSCGEAIARCPRCGATVRPTGATCGECGFALHDDE